MNFISEILKQGISKMKYETDILVDYRTAFNKLQQ